MPSNSTLLLTLKVWPFSPEVSFDQGFFEVGLDINLSSIELGIFKIRGLNSMTFLLKVINIVRKYSIYKYISTSVQYVNFVTRVHKIL